MQSVDDGTNLEAHLECRNIKEFNDLLWLFLLYAFKIFCPADTIIKHNKIIKISLKSLEFNSGCPQLWDNCRTVPR